MKRGISKILAAALLLPALSAGAATHHGFWDVGVKGGFTEGEVDGNDVDKSVFDDRAAIAAGAFVTARLTEYVVLRFEGLYVQKGAEFKTPGQPDATLDLTYLDFPLLGVATFPVVPWLRLDGFSGFSLDFNTSADSTSIENSVDVSDRIKTLEVAWIFGGGVELLFESLTATAEIRWTIGLTSIDETPRNGDIRNSSLCVLFGLALPLGKAHLGQP